MDMYDDVPDEQDPLVQELKLVAQQDNLADWLRERLPCRIDGWQRFRLAVKRYFSDVWTLELRRDCTCFHDGLTANVDWVVPANHTSTTIRRGGHVHSGNEPLRWVHCSACGQPIEVPTDEFVIMHTTCCPALTQLYLAPPQTKQNPNNNTYRWVCAAV